MTSGKPPQLPPRPTPPALPPRPGTSTSASLVRPAQHETSSKAENTASKVPVPSESSIALSSTTTGSSDDSFQSNLAGDLSITIPGKPADPEETAVPPETVDVPAITHTAASSPECEGAQRFALSRSSSNSSLHSIASCSSGSGPVKPRSNPESQRPFLQLYGKLTAEQQYHAALEELQALEVEEFLTRTSKVMEEMKFDTTLAPVVLPDIPNYRGKNVFAEYFRFAEAWLCAQAEAYLPRDLLAAPKPDRFSFSQSKLALERLYVLVPPSLLERLLAGHVVNLYRWKDPVKTVKWAGLYLALWYYDQLPAAFFAFMIYSGLKPKLYPPSPAEVQQRLAERHARSKEAQELDEDLSKRQKVAGISQSLAQSVGVAALMGGIEIGPNRRRAVSEQQNASTAKDDFSSDSELDDTSHRHRIAPTRRHRGKYGMYRLIREMLHRFGPSTMLLINDAADYLEKSKNFILWRRPSATKQSLAVLACWTLCLSIMSARLQLKLLLLWVWAHFFIVWPIQDRHPRYRRALNPWWWLLWNVPNDAECALEILQKRAALVPPTKPSLQHRRSRSHSGSSVKSSLSFHRRSSSSLAQLEVSSTPGDAVKSRHFALLKGIPGHLQFTETDVFFTSVRGFRSISSRIWRKSSASSSFLGMDGVSTPDEAQGRRMAFQYSLDMITAVKKESRFDIGVFDTDGLQITFSDGKVVRLSSVHKRDEVFAYILAHSTNRRVT